MAIQLVLDAADDDLPEPISGGGDTGSLLPYLADYIFILGGTDTATKTNRAPNKTVQAEFVGAPTVAANYVRCGPDNYLRTAAAIGGPVTFVAVFRNVNGGRANFGTYDLSTQKGLLAYISSATNFDAGVNGTFATTAFNPGNSDFVFYAATFDGNVVRLYIIKNGAIAAQAQTAKVDTLVPAKLKLAGLGSGLGELDGAALLGYPMVLNQDEILSVYKRLKRDLAAQQTPVALA